MIGSEKPNPLPIGVSSHDFGGYDYGTVQTTQLMGVMLWF